MASTRSKRQARSADPLWQRFAGAGADGAPFGCASSTAACDWPAPGGSRLAGTVVVTNARSRARIVVQMRLTVGCIAGLVGGSKAGRDHEQESAVAVPFPSFRRAPRIRAIERRASAHGANGTLRPARHSPKASQMERMLMLKFIGGTVGIIFLIGLLVVIGLLSLIF